MKEIYFDIEKFWEAINDIYINFKIPRETPQSQSTIYNNVIKTILFYYYAAESRDIEFINDIDIRNSILAIIKDKMNDLERTIIVIACKEDYHEDFQFLLNVSDRIREKFVNNEKIANILYIIPNEKFDTEKKSELQYLLSRPENSRFRCMIWDFEDLKPLIEEYSIFVSGFSEIFRDLALNNIFNSGFGSSSRKQMEKWNNINKKLLETISQIESNKLILNIGAGISQSAGLPGWDELLKNLMIKAIGESKKYINKNLVESLEDGELEYYANRIHHQEKNSPLIEAQLIKFTLFPRFRQEIDNFFAKRNQKYSNLIKSIVNFCNFYELTEVITYNFDDLMEKMFKKSVWSIYNNKTYTQKSDEMNIYHVHGYLPEAASEIILSEWEYYRLLQDNSFWANDIQETHYTNSHCLLIGLSIKDPNLRRIMFNSQLERIGKYIIWSPFRPHFAFIKKTSLDEFFTARGKSDYMAKTEATEKVLTLYHALKQLTYLQLGVNVIWVTEYDEIPAIINGLIRNRKRSGSSSVVNHSQKNSQHFRISL